MAPPMHSDPTTLCQRSQGCVPCSTFVGVCVPRSPARARGRPPLGYGTAGSPVQHLHESRNQPTSSVCSPRPREPHPSVWKLLKPFLRT